MLTLAQSFPIILGTGYTSDAPPVPALVSVADVNGLRLSTGFVSPSGLTTSTGSGLYAWLLLPHADENFASTARCPTSLRLWRTGGTSTTGFVLPSYRVGVARPATYTPNTGLNGPTGTYSFGTPGTFSVDWLSTETADNNTTYSALAEQVIALTPAGALVPTYNRGQVVIRVKLPSSNAGTIFTIWGVGFRS